ncbi:MobA/MobL family protein [Mesorhizobium sp. M0664]|uniref:MobA/MobL family protein n=1 Tax=Mesorhizobium sp. M0664 TaxID=2956982 RepID=UPI0033369B26
MAIFHLHVKNISRGDGRSVVAAAAYRAGETLPNDAEERESAFGGRRDVVHAEIRMPAGAPVWMGERAKLWNAVEAAEKRKDARLAKEIEFALPREVAPAIWLELTGAMADAYTRQGYVVDLAIHEDGRNTNPHAHLLLTTRRITAGGFAGKLREADGVRFVTDARAMWAKIANASFASAGLDARIDSRSHAAIGSAQRAGQHVGADRQARRARRAQIDVERIATVRQELRMPNPLAELYPHLSLRRDWPPETREPASDMSERERDEFWLYWQSRDHERGDPVAGRDRPVPGPEGDLIPSHELEAAQDRMIAEVEQPAGRYPLPNAQELTAENDRAWWVNTEHQRQPETEPDAPERDREPWWRTR